MDPDLASLGNKYFSSVRASLLHRIANAQRVISLEAVLFAILCGAIAHAGYYLLRGLDNPLLDMFYGRQTETSLTTYWVLRDGIKLAYETPVVGYPWAIPLEFPLYQWLQALVTYTGLSLDATGRLVNFAFFLACLLPIRMLYATLGLGRRTFLITAILIFCSPLYIYWSRTVMIESCELFFALLWLALLSHLLTEESWLLLAATIAAGAAATLTKGTTFVAPAMLGGLLTLACVMKRRQEPVYRNVRTLILAGLACAVPLALAYAWIAYSDNVKVANPFGTLMTMSALRLWNFGTLDQRLSSALWHGVILGRALFDTFGYGRLVALAILANMLMLPERNATYVLAAAAAFLLPFLIFTNLHLVQNYYQYANAIFALAAVGLALNGFIEAKRPRLALGALTVIVIGQIAYFHTNFAIYITQDYSQVPVYRISLLSKQYVPRGDALIVLGEDWSSVVAYYSQRKSLTLAAWFPESAMRDVFANPTRYLGGLPLGGIVRCADFSYDKNRASLIEQFLAGRSTIAEAGECKLFAPER